MNTKSKTLTLASRFKDKFTVEVRNVTPEQRKTLLTTGTTLGIVGAVLFLLILIQVVTKTGIATLDHQVELWINTLRNADTTGFMISLAIAFGPIVLPIVVILTMVFWFIFSKHAWRPLIFAAFMTFGLLLVQVISRIVQRPRPPIGLMLMGPDPSFSFPSGHVLGTSDFVLILSYLIISRNPSLRRIILGITISVLVILTQMVSRMYLGYHWMSDTLSSASLAIFVLGLLIIVDTRRTVKLPNEKITGKMSKPQTENT